MNKKPIPPDPRIGHKRRVRLTPSRRDVTNFAQMTERATFTWPDGTAVDVLPGACRLCSVRAVVALTRVLLAKQPDETTHVCHPALGGCGHGYAAPKEDYLAVANARVADDPKRGQ